MICLFWGHTEMLRGYFWLYVWGSLLVVLGTIWVGAGRTWVGHRQDRYALPTVLWLRLPGLFVYQLDFIRKLYVGTGEGSGMGRVLPWLAVNPSVNLSSAEGQEWPLVTELL